MEYSHSNIQSKSLCGLLLNRQNTVNEMDRKNLLQTIDEGVREGIACAIESHREIKYYIPSLAHDLIFKDIKASIDAVEVENNKKVIEQLKTIIHDLYKRLFKREGSLNEWQK